MIWTVEIYRKKDGKPVMESSTKYPSRAQAASVLLGYRKATITRDQANCIYRVEY